MSGLPRILLLRLWLVGFLGFAMGFHATPGQGQPVGQAAEIPQNQRTLWEAAKKHMLAGAPRAALPFLEELVTLAPNRAVFRLELAYALFQIGDDERAGYHLTLVRGGALTNSENAATETILTRIRDRKNWVASYRLNMVPQSNIGLRTSQRTITIGGLDFVPTPPEAGAVLGLGGSLTYLPKLGRDLRGRMMVSGDFKVSETRAFRDYTVRGETGILWQKDHGRQFGFGASYEIRRVADRPYSRASGLYLSYGSRIGAAGTVAIRAEHVQRTYAGNLFKNGAVSQVSARYTHVVNPALLLRADAVVVRTKATGARHSGTNTALTIGGQIAFSGGFVANLDVTLGVDQRNGIHPLFGVTRQDRRRSVALRLRKRDLRIGNFVPEISVGYTNVKSTLPINSYRNTYMSLQLSRQF